MLRVRVDKNKLPKPVTNYIYYPKINLNEIKTYLKNKKIDNSEFIAKISSGNIKNAIKLATCYEDKINKQRAKLNAIFESSTHLIWSVNKNRELTVKVELHKVNPYQILWIGERPFDHRGQEDTFVRFSIDQQGNSIGGYSHVQKKFVIPKFNSSSGAGVGPNAFETEDGDRVQDSGVNGDPEQSAGEFP